MRLVGGAGYPLTDWMMVPYSHQNLTWTQHEFNGKSGKGARRGRRRVPEAQGALGLPPEAHRGQGGRPLRHARRVLRATQHLRAQQRTLQSQLQETTTFVARFAGNYQVVNLLQKTP